jgi:hypothetical protein
MENSIPRHGSRCGASGTCPSPARTNISLQPCSRSLAPISEVAEHRNGAIDDWGTETGWGSIHRSEVQAIKHDKQEERAIKGAVQHAQPIAFDALNEPRHPVAGRRRNFARTKVGVFGEMHGKILRFGDKISLPCRAIAQRSTRPRSEHVDVAVAVEHSAEEAAE